MPRRPANVVRIVVLIIIGIGLCVAGLCFALNRGVASRLGPVHTFPANHGETALSDERVAEVARTVMTQDGYPETAWRCSGDRANHGVVWFYSEAPSIRQRFVHVELNGREITAQGNMGK